MTDKISNRPASTGIDRRADTAVAGKDGLPVPESRESRENFAALVNKAEPKTPETVAGKTARQLSRAVRHARQRLGEGGADEPGKGNADTDNSRITQAGGDNSRITPDSQTPRTRTGSARIAQADGDNPQIARTDGDNPRIAQDSQSPQTRTGNARIAQADKDNSQIAQTRTDNSRIARTTDDDLPATDDKQTADRQPDEYDPGNLAPAGLTPGTAQTETRLEGPAQTAPPREINEVARQIAERIQVSAPDSQTDPEVRIQLKSDVLEGSEVRISREHGELSIVFVPSSRDAENLIARHRQDLEQSLGARLPEERINLRIETADARAGAGQEGDGRQGDGRRGDGQERDGRSRQRYVADDDDVQG